MLLIASLLGLAACERGPAAELAGPPPAPAAPAPPTRREIPKDHWVVRTDPELEDLLRQTCEASVADGRPILLEFSAPWCLDCKVLAKMEHEPPLEAEYAHWHRVRADVGNFNRHELFLAAFGVGAIAHWVALKPTDCAVLPPEWPRLAQGPMEVATGAAGPQRAADVVRWLVAARGSP